MGWDAGGQGLHGQDGVQLTRGFPVPQLFLPLYQQTQELTVLEVNGSDSKLSSC